MKKFLILLVFCSSCMSANRVQNKSYKEKRDIVRVAFFYLIIGIYIGQNFNLDHKP